MIISHSRSFIFVKTFKTAGSSLEIALSQYCGPKDILTPLHPDEEQLRKHRFRSGARNYYKPFNDIGKFENALALLLGRRVAKFFEHSSAYQIRKALGEELWNKYFTFTIVRDPFDRIMSRFYYSGNFPYEHIRRTRWGGFTRSDPEDLDQFLRYHPDLINENWCLYTERDEILVDFCIRYEHLEQDLAVVSKRLGLPRNLFEDLKPIKAKGKYRPAADREFALNDEQRAVIRYLCRPEIEAFDYEARYSRSATGDGPEQAAARQASP